jgi:hypothetical protein
MLKNVALIKIGKKDAAHRLRGIRNVTENAE